jgi:hypothetical protein
MYANVATEYLARRKDWFSDLSLIPQLGGRDDKERRLVFPDGSAVVGYDANAKVVTGIKYPKGFRS